MHIPNNEGKVCDAVVQVLEKWTGKTRTNVRRPDKDHTVPDDRRVDLRLRLGAQEYAIEHTRIGPFENEIMTNIRFTKRHGYIKERVSDSLPGPAYYVLEIPVDFRLPANRKQREEELNALIVWIQMSAHYLQEVIANRIKQTGSPDRTVISLKVTQLKFGCDMELLRMPFATLAGREPGSLSVWPIYPDDNDAKERRFKRLQQAFADKCPKLEKCKEEGARTVLILEGAELALMRDDHIGHQLNTILTTRTDTPDEIYLVRTSTLFWCVFPVKRDTVHWPTHMPEYPLYIYDEGTPPTAGIPEWYPDSLRADDLYPTYPRGWAPVVFQEDELDQLADGIGPP